MSVQSVFADISLERGNTNILLNYNIIELLHYGE